uniref:uncharacterized protein LOC122587978 n=1 Tax=Erigeron canadensis TaxID=72917 RepID=UPI001CB90B57|nr:uncharacterized protein LOC122587978 [Erigeron canadensis]
MKLWERVIDMRLTRVTKVAENQFGFMPVRSSMEAIHITRTLMEKYRERQKALHCAFLDLEKAYDSVPRELIWRTLQAKGLTGKYFSVIRDMYDRTRTGVRTPVGNTELFSKELNRRLEKWRRALEDNGLCVSREKAEYLRCDFDKLKPRIKDTQIGGIDEDVTHRIQAGWMKWIAASGVMCDKRIPLKLKGKFYRAAIRPAMLYGSECWPITKAQASWMEVAEMRMLRWTCEKKLSNRIPTGVFRDELEVGSIINKLREERLRWFGHVRRRDQAAPPRRAESIHVDGVRRRGRSKMRWEERLAKDLKELGLSEDMTSDRTAWRIRIRVVD